MSRCTNLADYDMEHPTPSALVEYSVGFAGTELVLELERHLCECRECRQIVAETVWQMTVTQKYGSRAATADDAIAAVPRRTTPSWPC